MKTLLLFLISSIIVLANVGKITSIKGEVYIERETKQISAKVGSILEVKDQVLTKDNSKAILLFNDNMSITIGKNSTLQVKKYVFDKNIVANNKATLKFGKGIFRTITGKLGKLNPRGFMIKTSTATIGIRGSDGVTRVGDDGSVQHTTYSGGFVLTDNISGHTVWIPKGIKATLNNDGIIVLPVTKTDLKEDIKFIGKPLKIKNIDQINLIQKEKSSEKIINTVNKTIAKIVNDVVIPQIAILPVIIPPVIIPPVVTPPVVTPPAEEDIPFDIEALTQSELDDYLSGDIADNLTDYITPTSIIDDYIDDEATSSYSGNINGVVNEESPLSGTISLDMDFGAQTFDGNIYLSDSDNDFDTPLSGTIDNNGFIADEIDNMNPDTSKLVGKFYGDNAGVIAGTTTLENESEKTFTGNFIGKK